MADPLAAPLDQDPQHFLESALDRKVYAVTSTEAIAVGPFEKRPALGPMRPCRRTTRISVAPCLNGTRQKPCETSAAPKPGGLAQ